MAEREEEEEDEERRAQREKPAVPGAHLEVDIVPEGVDPLGRRAEAYEDPYAIEEEASGASRARRTSEEVLGEPIATRRDRPRLGRALPRHGQAQDGDRARHAAARAAAPTSSTGARSSSTSRG